MSSFTIDIESGNGYWAAMLPPGSVDNAAIIDAFTANREHARCTHLFGGRYENIYLESEKVPALKPVFDFVSRMAGQILGLAPEALHYGFWFNCMEPGHVTTLHSHDDFDEMMSGVYYIEAPENSGDLVIVQGNDRVVVPPVTGRCVMFRPDVMHEVTENRSDRMRLSIGINITRLADDDEA